MAVRVFISYRHDTEAHDLSVRALADALRGHGVDAWIDQYDPHQPLTWEEWMVRQMEDAAYILVICTEKYKHTVRREGKVGEGLGVLQEFGQIREELNRAGGVNPKFLPVLLPGSTAEDIPTGLRGFNRYSVKRFVREDKGYEALLRRIYQEPEVVAPSLGVKPDFTAPVSSAPVLGAVPDLPPVAPKRAILEMVPIPAGSFMMGGNVYDNEQPIHRVELSGYSISKYPVRVQDYLEYSKGKKVAMPPFPDFNKNWSKKEHPIVNVSWFDAKGYCGWLSEVTGEEYDLPTEAEWEYAARGGLKGKKYPWEGDFDVSKLCCRRSEGTCPVGSYAPNGYGLYDMVGNVWEWCLDSYDANYYNNSPEKNPLCNNSNGVRVLRGGSWSDGDPDYFRCVYRSRYTPVNRNYLFGFRVVFRGLL